MINGKIVRDIIFNSGAREVSIVFGYTDNDQSKWNDLIPEIQEYWEKIARSIINIELEIGFCNCETDRIGYHQPWCNAVPKRMRTEKPK